MPFLAALAIDLLTTLFRFLAQYLTRTVAARIATGLLAAAAAAVMWATVKAAILAAQVVAPTALGTALTWIVPPQLTYIVSMRVAASAAIASYRWYKSMIGLTNSAGGKIL